MAWHSVVKFGTLRSSRERSSGYFLAGGRLILLLFLMSISGCAATHHGGPDPVPCGPSSWPVAARRLIPQQIGGADFRPACCCHDQCYATSGAKRPGCDDRFHQQLRQACDTSRHPVLCRLVAAAMHASVVVCGEPRYRQGQQQSVSCCTEGGCTEGARTEVDRGLY